MPKDKCKGKGRGRKRKSSPPVEETANTETEQQANDANTTNNGGKYVPRFGNAAKRQRLESGGKKLTRDGSDGEELVLCPVSCTQPVGGAKGAELEEEWSSTQPASKVNEVSYQLSLPD